MMGAGLVYRVLITAVIGTIMGAIGGAIGSAVFKPTASASVDFDVNNF